MPTQDNMARAMTWLDQIIRQRLGHPESTTLVPPPEFPPARDPFSEIIESLQPSYAELAILTLALAPHVAPGRLDTAIGSALSEGASLPEAGGARGIHHRGLLPTGETALWLLAGSDLAARAHLGRLFGPEHWFATRRVLELETVRDGEPLSSGRMILDTDFVELMAHGRISAPRFSTAFPAQHITTEMDWDDLVLHPATLSQIRDIQNWVTYNGKLSEWGLDRRVKPGYRALFYGPPGTGKTLTATLLGKHTKRDVFRIDLSRVVSKYIGETEQNLARLFDRAESKDWILFFDEADALFGKRTEIRDAHDKYANQEAAYLLQRIETFDGLVILATNQRNNVDEAFVRRFQSVIHFPMPRAEERLLLWSNSLPAQVALSTDVSLDEISTRYEISGAAIMNVVQHCSIGVLADAAATIDRRRLESAIHREFVKEGKVV
jgi:AAA+ superfamily predicted ATPase